MGASAIDTTILAPQPAVIREEEFFQEILILWIPDRQNFVWKMSIGKIYLLSLSSHLL